MQATVIINRGCGALARGRDGLSIERVREALARTGRPARVECAAGADLERSIRAAAERHAPAVIVGGGDGTVSTAARVLAGSATALGVLPLGTLNHFARDLGVADAWQEAIAGLATAQPRRIDVGEINERIFVNNCSLGAYPQAVMRRDRLRGRHGSKWLAMAVAAIAEFSRLRRLRLRIEVETEPAAASTPADPQEFSQRTPLLVVSNNRYGGNVLSPVLRDSLNGGLLWLYYPRATSRWALLRMMWQAVTRRIESAEQLESRPATSLVIHTRKPVVPIGVDGEVLHLRSPLRLRIRPQHLLVLAPPQRSKPA